MSRFDEARNIDIFTVIKAYGIEVSNSGYFKCPFCGHNDGAIKNNKASCYHPNCMFIGSTIDFVSKIEGVNHIEAVNIILGDRFSKVKYNPIKSIEKEKENTILKNMILKNSRLLSRSEEGLKYFEDRGLLKALPLINKDQLQIKYNEYNGNKSIIYRFIKNDFIIQKSIYKNADGKRFVRNFGKVEPFIMRSYEHNKYMIVEGIEDGLTALLLGYNFISLNSVSNVGKLIECFKANREWINKNTIILCLDNDNAGNEGTNKIIDYFSSTGLVVENSIYKNKMIQYNIKDLNQYYIEIERSIRNE